MRFSTPFCLLILTCLCVALAHVSYEDCCLKYVKKLSQKTQRHAIQYRVQSADGGCNLPAIIFTMKRGRKFCTDPQDHWVKNLMKKIDEREPRNNKPRTNKKNHPHIVN